MRKSPKFSSEVMEVRMVFDAKDQYASRWAAIESIARQDRLHGRHAAQVGGPGRARQWRSARTDHCRAPAHKELERKVRELRKTNEILKLASAYLAQAEFDRQLKK